MTTNGDNVAAPPLVHLDRQDSGSSQGLLGALFVQYNFGHDTALTSDDIVVVMKHFGVSESATRSALSRTVKRGTLTPQRLDGVITYVLTDRARKSQASKLDSVVQFGSDAFGWDGKWSACIFTVPEVRRDARQRFRNGLASLGYGQTADGVWLNPWDRHAETRKLADLHLIDLLLIRGPVDTHGQLDPLAGFQLEYLRHLYEDYLRSFESVSTEISQGRGTTSTLEVRTRALRDWRRIAAADPQLPRDVLPSDWPRATAYRLFRSLWDGLEASALDELRDILNPTNPAAAERMLP